MLQRLPLHLLARYAADRLLHAETGFQGRVSARQTADGWQVDSNGDRQITERQVNTLSLHGRARRPGAARPVRWPTVPGRAQPRAANETAPSGTPRVRRSLSTR